MLSINFKLNYTYQKRTKKMNEEQDEGEANYFFNGSQCNYELYQNQKMNPK